MKNNNAISDIGAGVLCFFNKKVLLVQMNYGKYSGQWILPGGMVEVAEHPHAAAIREAKEETNLDVELTQLLFIRHRVKKEETNNTYWVFKGNIITPNPEDEIRWPKEELLMAKLWDIEEAINDSSVRAHTKYYIETALNKNTSEFMSPLESSFNDYFYNGRTSDNQGEKL